MRILRLPEVKATLGHSADETVYGAIRAGMFTAGVAIGQRAKGWPDYEVQAIAAARIAGYTTEQIKTLVKQLHAKRYELAPMIQPPAVQPQTGPKWSANALAA
ncbi:MAG: AlpA family phage regulatory protein [Rhodoferax sp.]|nr:AlpA family phage regulatory protein [Rhodoferax sp.]